MFQTNSPEEKLGGILSTIRGVNKDRRKARLVRKLVNHLGARFLEFGFEFFHFLLQSSLNLIGVRRIEFLILKSVSKTSPSSVRKHFEFLVENKPELVGVFVETVLRKSANPNVFFLLSRHHSSKSLFRDWLSEVYRANAVHKLCDRGPVVTAAFAGAARILLAASEAEDLENLLAYEHPEITTFFRSITDSFELSVQKRPLSVNTSPRRLIITENFNRLDQLSLLVPGASHCTFFGLNDLFGKANFNEFKAWTHDGEIEVEHPRSRIGRFTAAYVEIKESCDELAKQITSVLGEEILPRPVRPYLELEVADFLFFRALKIEALRFLAQDDDFDEVLVVLDGQSVNSVFVALLNCCEELISDPRLRFVSIATTTAARKKFGVEVDAVLDATRSQPVASSDRKPLDSYFFHSQQPTGHTTLIRKPKGRRHINWLLLATADRSPYNASTASFTRVLSQKFGIALLSLGSQAVRLRSQLDKRLLFRLPLTFVSGPVGLGDYVERLAKRLVRGIQMPPDVRQKSAQAAFISSAKALCAGVILPFVWAAEALRADFSYLTQTGSLPSAVVLTPNREPRAAMIAGIARTFGVPSVALEPHLIEPTYSRYVKVGTDFYGVPSNSIKNKVCEPYGISPDRVFAIGSPKLRSAGNPRPEPRRTGHPNLVFFSQPGLWEVLGKVWQIIIDAAQQSHVNVVLKPHPEDTPTTIQRYLAEAAAGGISNVKVLRGDANEAFKQADYTAVLYSTTGVESVLRGIPTFCIAPEGRTYPLDLAAMLGIPRVTDSRELEERLRYFSHSRAEFDVTLSNLLAAEPQFVDGFEPGLLQLMDFVISQGELGLRPVNEIPESLFLDPPHPVFRL